LPQLVTVEAIAERRASLGNAGRDDICCAPNLNVQARPALVMQVIEPIWTTKLETASRLRWRIQVILDWAKVRGYREGKNPERWRGHLHKLLPADHLDGGPMLAPAQYSVNHPGVVARRLVELEFLARGQSGDGAWPTAFTRGRCICSRGDAHSLARPTRACGYARDRALSTEPQTVSHVLGHSCPVTIRWRRMLASAEAGMTSAPDLILHRQGSGTPCPPTVKFELQHDAPELSRRIAPAPCNFGEMRRRAPRIATRLRKRANPGACPAGRLPSQHRVGRAGPVSCVGVPDALTDGVAGEGRRLFELVTAMDLEDIVAKRFGDPYAPGSTSWWKILNRSYSQKQGRSELFERG
jgi:hypothetical protein